MTRPLSDVALQARRGAASPQELFDAFVAATLYWPAPTKQGLPVIRIGEDLVAPVFSSEAELIKVGGRGEWLASSGLELLSILPGGVTIGLDIGSDHRLQLDPAAAKLDYELVVRQRTAAPQDNDGAGTDAEMQR